MTRSSLLLACMLTGCGPPAQAPAKAVDTPAKLDPKPPTAPDAPFATPKARPPPAPEGAVLLEPPLYALRCDAAHPCPSLLQPAGETHCRELRLGGLAHWRLPDREEVKRFAGVQGLEQQDGFHWTRTPFAEDAAQAWIVDPKSGQETTIPRTRKPFTIRCVFDP
ncbi:MAG: hypothetical protein IPO88_31810 [Nannocystis sp.]|uniref:hypothetical protein n=1 Tax=Nannocystis sp. TaxID=1962667 RepID=UPI002425EF52|nr:hypothetical protein [Nannocystis sp.]MBK9758022.1 hypothetical protein [Nannocystis sp.]